MDIYLKRENNSIFNQKEEVNFLKSLYKCIEDGSKDIEELEEDLEEELWK